MVRSEIVEGFKVALHKGESLKEAMMSFYNAGYSKKDIEEAARNLYLQQDAISKEHQIQHEAVQEPKKHFKPLPSPSSIKVSGQSNFPSSEKRNQSILSSSQKYPIKQPSRSAPSTTPVSDYDLNKPKSKKLLIILLILIIVIILGSVSSFFLFKEQLLDFFNNLFINTKVTYYSTNFNI